MRMKKVFARTAAAFTGLILCLQLLMPITAFAENNAEAANAALDNFLNSSAKLIGNGGVWDEESQSGVNVSSDRLTYTIGVKQSGSENEIDKLIFSVRKFEDDFKPQITLRGEGYLQYFDNKWGPNINKTPVKIKKRSSAEDKSFIARLALYPKGTYEGKIKNEEIDPLAYRDFNVILKSKALPAEVTIKGINKKTNEEVSNIRVNIYKNQDKTGPVPPSSGKYKLDKGKTYYIWVQATGYNDYFEALEVNQSGAVQIKLTPIPAAISEYKLKINVKNPKGEAVNNPRISVVIPAEDPDAGDEDEDVAANIDGTYTLKKMFDYDIRVSAAGYKTLDGKSAFTKYGYSPSGDEENIVLDVVLTNGNDQTDEFKKISKIKNVYDSSLSALRPNFMEDNDINAFVKKYLKGKSELSEVNFDDVTFEVKSTEDEEYIGSNGAIKYRKGILNDNLTVNIGVVFNIKCGAESISTGSKKVTIGWDRNYYRQQMQKEADMVTKTFLLKGQIVDLDALDSNFTLPTAVKENKQEIWSEIEWSSSNENVIKFESNPLRPFEKIVKVTQTGQEETVTLTAKFVAVENHLNSFVGETPATFPTIEKNFVAKVKAIPVQSEDELRALLDTYYKDINDYATGEKSNLTDIVGDLQLPRYTKIKDSNNQLVFNNGEIKVTSDNAAAVVNGYRVAIDPFYTDNKTGKLTVEFTRKGVTVTKDFNFTIGTVSDSELDKEARLIAVAKENYFDGIRGENEDKDNITKNLHAFHEMKLDGGNSPVWVYNASEVKNTGVIADGFWREDQSVEMEASGYNKFKSSNPEVIKHENLVVIRQPGSQKVTITSWLSSAKYGRFAPLHSDNAKLQQIYKQSVSVDLTVTGTAPPAPKPNKGALIDAIDTAKLAKKDIAESADGNDVPSTGKWVTKEALDKLNNAISEAEAVANDEDANQKQVDNAQTAVKRAVIDFKAHIRNGNKQNNESNPNNKPEGKTPQKTKPATNQSARVDNVEYAPVYNYSYYIDNNPDVKAAFNGDKKAALNHFVNYGINEGRRGCEWFDVDYYKGVYGDLQTAFGDDLKSYYLHYINYGKNEGRKGCEADVSTPNMPAVADDIDYSSVYDYDYYINNNPDIKAAFKGNRKAALNHFINYGMNEGRQGCEWFDVSSYKNAYNDLRAAYKGDLRSYYMHFINYGVNEGRNAVDVSTVTNPVTTVNGADYSSVYDYSFYLDNNPDVKAAYYGDEDAVLNHFITCGMDEGRVAHPGFDVWIYRANYGDLQAAFNDDFKSYYMHYINCGISEGRSGK